MKKTESPKKLVLKKDSIRALTAHDLKRVVGGYDEGGGGTGTINSGCGFSLTLSITPSK